MLGAFNPPRLRTIPDIAPFTRSQRIANGPDLIRAGEAVRRAEKNRDAWPFVHVYPPVNSQRRNPTGFIQSPAIAAQAVVLAFSVPSGFWFYLQQLGLYYSGAPANGTDCANRPPTSQGDERRGRCRYRYVLRCLFWRLAGANH